MNAPSISPHTSNILLKYRGGPLIIGAVHLFNLLTHHNSSALALLDTAPSSQRELDEYKPETQRFVTKVETE